MAVDPNDSGDLSAGDEIPGGYTIEEPVVQGRTRVIYAARSGDGGLVAVHLLDAGLVDGLGEWFAQCATARAAVEHPTLPKTLYVGHLADGRPFEVTEFLEGTSMREALDTSAEGLDPLAVVHVVNEVAAALDALHGRAPPVVHRTLCPEHLMVLRDTHEVRLLGLYYADRPQFEAVRPGYRSPEELAGILSLGPRADVFSLATVAYELLTGRPAWPHVPELALDSMRVGVRDRVSVLRPVLPTALDAVFERAWSLSPDARQASAGRFAKALRAAIDPLDLAASLASNVFDDRPTAQVPVLSLRVRNNTLLNAGAVAQAIVPRAVVGKVRASESESENEKAPEARISRPPARTLRAPVPPGTRPVREGEADGPAKITLARPEDVFGPSTPKDPASVGETPVAGVPVTPEHTGPTDVVRLLPSVPPEPTKETELPGPEGVAERPSESPVSTPPAEHPELPDEPTPLHSSPSRAVVAEVPDARRAGVSPPAVQSPSPIVEPFLHDRVSASPAPVMGAPPPQPVRAPPVAPSYASPLDSPPLQRRPEAHDPRLFVDEPTTLINLPAAPTTTWTRSPTALAALFVAHAILIVGIAHAISFALVHRQPATVQLIPGPAPVCAPCAACLPPLAGSVDGVDVPVAAHLPAVVRVTRPLPARPAGRTQLIRSVPDFGRPR